MVQADHASPQLYDRWIVQREHLELSPAEQEIFKKDLFKKGWKLENAEITSRKLNFFTEDWSGEVEAVLETLRRINESESYHLITNASTGLHVHVGNDTQPIPLRTAKNIYQLLTAFERQLDHLHSSDRIEVPNSPCGTDSHLPPCVFHTLKTQASGVAEWVEAPLINRLYRHRTRRNLRGPRQALHAIHPRRRPRALRTHQRHQL